MRELVFSVGITFLTGTLLFVYFRNKMSNIDRKVNMVFETIQEHNNRMQVEAQEEMKRFQMYHEQRQQMQMQQMQQMKQGEETQVPLTEENVNEMIQTENNLIDVSDEDSQFDSSEDDSDDEDSDNENIDNEQPEKVVEPVDNNASLEENLEVEVLEDNTDDVVVDEEKHDGLEIMEDKLEIKSLEPLVDYNKLTKAQLRNICEDKGLTGWKSLNKGKLVELLKNNN